MLYFNSPSEFVWFSSAVVVSTAPCNTPDDKLPRRLRPDTAIVHVEALLLVDFIPAEEGGGEVAWMQPSANARRWWCEFSANGSAVEATANKMQAHQPPSHYPPALCTTFDNFNFQTFAWCSNTSWRTNTASEYNFKVFFRHLKAIHKQNIALLVQV